jgi:hypothetical protein
MWWLAALAWGLPDIDEPVVTGHTASADAAVVIGIEDYFVLPDVPHATRDAAAAEATLRETVGVPPERIRVLTRGANREQILAAVTSAGESVGPGGTVWLTYAGHGAADPSTGERLLLGADAQADQLSFRARAVPVAELEALATAGGGEAVLLLDTCYSGRTRDGGDLVAGKRFAVPSYATEAPDRVHRWTAAGPSEWSSPLPSVRHGAFTYAALGALRGWADTDGDGAVTAGEAHDYVVRALPTLQITDQRPAFVGSRDKVLSHGSEAAPELSAPVSVIGVLVGSEVPPKGVGGLGLRTTPRSTVTAGPQVDLSRRGPYTQVYRPRTEGLVWAAALTAIGGGMALHSYNRADRVDTAGKWTSTYALNLTGGSIALLGAGIGIGALLPSKQAPIVEAP